MYPFGSEMGMGRVMHQCFSEDKETGCHRLQGCVADGQILLMTAQKSAPSFSHVLAVDWPARILALWSETGRQFSFVVSVNFCFFFAVHRPSFPSFPSCHRMPTSAVCRCPFRSLHLVKCGPPSPRRKFREPRLTRTCITPAPPLPNRPFRIFTNFPHPTPTPHPPQKRTQNHAAPPCIGLPSHCIFLQFSFWPKMHFAPASSLQLQQANISKPGLVYPAKDLPRQIPDFGFPFPLPVAGCD